MEEAEESKELQQEEDRNPALTKTALMVVPSLVVFVVKLVSLEEQEVFVCDVDII